jgi:hypothetical protein
VIEDDVIAAEILRQVQACAPRGSVGPGDVALALSPQWRPLLGAVRRVAIRLAADGRIEILRKGKPVDPAATRGVIRLRAAA